MPPVSRRRVLTLAAAAAAASLTCRKSRADTPRRWVWRGSALGAQATLILYHPDRQVAESALASCLAEVERLEGEFSLYRPESALSRLNRDGVLRAPSLDMLALLEQSRFFAAASGGAFDVTVQPLWRLYAEHFANHPHAAEGPPAADIARTCRLVDHRRLTISPQGIALAPGMAVTLNGIAQGYITDRIADLLRDRGWSNVLVELGEFRALGGHPDGGPWTIGLKQPWNAGERLPSLPLAGRALATSAGCGTVFDAAGRYGHLLDPRTGRSAAVCAQVTVVTGRATSADALSTALFVLPPEARRGLLARFAGTQCLIIEADGRLTRLAA